MIELARQNKMKEEQELQRLKLAREDIKDRKYMSADLQIQYQSGFPTLV